VRIFSAGITLLSRQTIFCGHRLNLQENKLRQIKTVFRI
jgi:hypothetical protein